MFHQSSGSLFPPPRHHPTILVSQLPWSSHNQSQGDSAPSSTSFPRSALPPPAQTTLPNSISGQQLSHPLSSSFPSSTGVAPSVPCLDTVQPSSRPSALPLSLHSADHTIGNVLWLCSLGCGKRYEKSSGRSIRRHMTSCFRSHWPGGSTLSDSEVQALMSEQQESGHLVTGLRRWKMRQSTRSTVDLGEGEKWACPQGCGQVYRVSSTRSIQKHAVTCKRRSSGQPTEDSGCCSDDSDESPRAAVVDGEEGKEGEDLRVRQSDTQLERSVALGRLPTQSDGFVEDIQHGQEMDESSDALLRESTSIGLNATYNLTTTNVTSTLEWENTPIRRLLRRQQLEIEHLSAQHFMEVIALRDQSAIAVHNSALRLGVQVPNASPQ